MSVSLSATFTNTRSCFFRSNKLACAGWMLWARWTSVNVIVCCPPWTRISAQYQGTFRLQLRRFKHWHGAHHSVPTSIPSPFLPGSYSFLWPDWLVGITRVSSVRIHMTRSFMCLLMISWQWWIDNSPPRDRIAVLSALGLWMHLLGFVWITADMMLGVMKRIIADHPLFYHTDWWTVLRKELMAPIEVLYVVRLNSMLRPG